MGGVRGQAERDRGWDLPGTQFQLRDLGVQAGGADPDLDRLLGPEVQLLPQRGQGVEEAAANLPRDPPPGERAVLAGTADLELAAAGRRGDRELGQPEARAVDVPPMGDARGHRRQRLREPVAVLVDGVPTYLAGAGVHVGVVVVAVLPREEPVAVAVERTR